MTKIIAISKLKDGVSIEQLYPKMKEESLHAWEFYKRGVAREFYLCANHPGAVLVFECENVEEARRLTDEFPFVEAGLIEFEFYVLGPFLSWEALFAAQAAH